MNKLKKILWLIPIILIYRYDLILYAEPMEDRVGEVFLMHFLGGSYNMDEIDLTVSVLGLIGIIFIDIVMVDYIIEDINLCAEYVFSRYRSRSAWYLKKVIGVIIYSNIGVLLYMLPYMANALYTSEQTLDIFDVKVLVSTYVMMNLFTIFSVLLLNLVSLYHGNTISFICVYSMLIISSIVTLELQGDAANDVSKILHRLNPMSNVLVSWNFSSSYVMGGIVYYLIASGVVALIMWNRIIKKEIGINVKTDVA